MRARWVALALWLLPAPAAADWQVRPFIGFSFGGATTFVDPDHAIKTQNVVMGISGGWLGEIFGLEADFGRAPGFFQTDDIRDPLVEHLVLTSSVTTLTGTVVVALPRRMAGYGLRPYFSGGAGLMHVDALGKFDIKIHDRTLPALNLGGGVTGFLTNRVGLNWDVRRLSTLRGEGETLGSSVGREQLSFWRATMAVALRYEVIEKSTIWKLNTKIFALTLALFVGALGSVAYAEGTLRIVPLVRAEQVIVSVDLDNGYTDEVRQVINGGVRTTFTYDVDLKMIVPAWVDRTIATAVVTTTDRYDTLTRVHNLSRSVDGRVVEALVTENEAIAKKWLTSLTSLVLCRTSLLDPHREYYVRISARVRPPGATLLGWATGVTNLAKFTFVP